MDNAPRELVKLVIDKIHELGDKAAAEYFEVSPATISGWKNLKTFPSLVAAQKVWDDTLLCQSPESWEPQVDGGISLLMPMYENLEPVTFYTLMRCIKQYGMEKVRILPRWRTLVVEARNELAERALLTPDQWFVFTDADSVYPCGDAAVMAKHGCPMPTHKAARNALARIMSHPADKLIVGACYKDRRGGTKFQCENGFASPSENQRLLGLYSGKTTTDHLEKVGWLGFGMVRIHRSVFERMKEAAKPGGPLEEIAPPKGREKEPYGFFDTSRAQRGEDVKFCRRAAKLGIDVWLDHGLLLGHIGKHCY
jgi:hypothetical protein